MNVGIRFRPRSGETDSETGRMMTRIAYDGIARPTLAMLIIRFAQRPVWPTYRPNGNAMIVAVTNAAAASARCSKSRFGIPDVPCQLAGSANQLMTSISGSRDASGSRE